MKYKAIKIDTWDKKLFLILFMLSYALAITITQSLSEVVLFTIACYSGMYIFSQGFGSNGKVKAHHKEGYMQSKMTRIAGKRSFSNYEIPDKYEIYEDCPECGKSKKEIERAFNTGITNELSHEERIKRLKESGLPTVIENKRDEEKID